MNALLPFALLLQSNALPLPERTDIPDNLSWVYCPSQQAAKTMLDDYYRVQPAPNNHGLDVTHYFKGLEATGCEQSPKSIEGTITIKQVLQRKKLDQADEDDRYIRFAGLDKDGRAIAGLVDEDSNNKMPRTPLAEWLSTRATNGMLDARGDNSGGRLFYRCDSVDAAKATVSAASKSTKGDVTKFEGKVAKLAAQNGCRPAMDKYIVTATHNVASFDCGFECYVELTALSATDRSGVSIGLIFDASLI
jgi:hypothetical protein